MLECGWGVEDFEVWVAFAEEAEGPFRAEEDDGAVGGVDGEDGVASVVDGGFGDWGAVFVLEPADVGPWGGFETGFGVVFGEEPVLDDFELEGADGSEEGDAASGVRLAEVLDDAFFEELVEAFAEAFEFCRAGISQVGETLWREAGNLVVGEGGVQLVLVLGGCQQVRQSFSSKRIDNMV